MSTSRKILLTLIALPLTVAVMASIASGAMRSERIDRGLCETTGGGRFVSIPGFPGEMIDRRLKKDVAMLIRKYKIYITDGYSTDPVHSANGEHPVGLALDIVPDTSKGGRWRDIDRLARWAEPKQNQPRMPFRWVGYDGDAGHGRGHHLHLSWDHSDSKFGKPARTVYTSRCPAAGGGGKGGKGGKDPAPAAPADPKPPEEPQGNGGVSPDSGGSRGGKGKSGKADEQSSGGVSPRKAKRIISRHQQLNTSVETDGVELP